MLRSLSIRDFAIIDRLDIEFGPGLNVLTGETGAGKSIVVGALNIILGGRAGADMVRAGAERTTVDAVFDLERMEEINSAVKAMGFDVEDDQLFLSREVATGGKSTARVSGRPATAAQLRELGEWLVDLHGQHEHQSLLAVPRHIDMLDAWGGRDVLTLRDEVAQAYRSLSELQGEREALETDARERERLIDVYQFQVNEIQQVGLQPGEEEDLREDSRRLANAQKLAEASSAAAAGLAGDGTGIVEHLAVVASALDGAAALDDRLAPLAESVRSARYELEEAARELARYKSEIEFNPDRVQEIEGRLDIIYSLRRKYGDTIEEILEYACHTEAKLCSLSTSEERGHELDSEIRAATERMMSLCGQLSERRQELACHFAHAVVAELADLAMEKTRFEVRLDPTTPGPKGAEAVEFLIAPNPGEPLRPLARIASGGEVSRIMLAIKSAMARQEPLPTMVFDEIDVGVGGRTAGVIGTKMDALAANAQIICITHLPQIASRASRHLCIEKHVIDGRTQVRLEPLSPEGRVEELARMLSGTEMTETVIQHAREMLHAG